MCGQFLKILNSHVSVDLSQNQHRSAVIGKETEFKHICKYFENTALGLFVPSQSYPNLPECSGSL